MCAVCNPAPFGRVRIVVLDGYTLNPGDLSWAAFEALGRLNVYDRTPAGEVIQRIGAADCVLTNKTPLPEEVFMACPSIRYVGVLATGYDIVDLQAAARRAVTITNVPSYGTEAVAQFAIAMLLEIASRVGQHARAVHEGRWENAPDFCFWEAPLMELHGKTLGIIGLGRIGRATARIAAALGLEVIASDSNPAADSTTTIPAVSLDTLLRCSDVIALHCPLTEETRGIINAASLSKMKDGVIILNNSRGDLIVEQDLANALNRGKVRAAAVDVVSTEPIRADNPLLQAKNCIITPHISWASVESRRRLMEIAANNLRLFLEGAPVNVVRQA